MQHTQKKFRKHHSSESWQSAISERLQWHKQLALRLDDYENKFVLSSKQELESSEKGEKRIRRETF